MFSPVLDAVERFFSKTLPYTIKRFPVTFLISLLIMPVALTVYDADAYFNLIVYLSALFVSVPAHLFCEYRQFTKKSNTLFTVFACLVSALVFMLAIISDLCSGLFSDTIFSMLLPVCTILSYLLLRGPHFDIRLILSLVCRFLCCLLFSSILSAMHTFLLRTSQAFFGQPSLFMSWSVLGFILITIPVNLFIAGIPECSGGKNHQ